MEKGKNFHQSCFTCKECKKPLNDKLQVFVNNDEVYCKTCYPKITQTLAIYSSDTSVIKGAENESCPRCLGKVFEAEKIQTRKFLFHKNCFSCKQCKHLLDYSSMYESKDGEVFCKGCYVNLFFTMGKNSYLERKNIPALEGDSACVKCSSKVFDLEKVLTKHGNYHLSCLSCANCDKTLNTSNFFSGPDRRIFCRNCYDILHGKRARSKSRGPIDLAQFQAQDNDLNQCIGCGGKIFEAEKFATCFGTFHAPCFKCSKCFMSLQTSPDTACSRNGKVLCRQCFGRERSKSVSAGNDEDGFLIYAKSIADSHIIPAADGDPFKCPRCSGKVFEAEKMSMKSGHYHKKCFSCFECRRPMDYSLATDGPDWEVYCTTCYQRNFGPQSFKSDVEALYRTDVIKPTDGSGCPICGGAVFEFEKVLSKNKSYHKKCAKCIGCNTNLDSRTLCDGMDGRIYCNGCNSRKFGSATYRGANTQNWVDGSVQISKEYPGARPCDPDDPNACNRCQLKVYELERVSCKNGVWHKYCFYCNGCRTSLNSTLVMAYESPDKQIYCKSCYHEAFGEGNIPLIYTETSKIKQSSGEDSCARCSGVVYEAERIRVSDKIIFHKFCFTCTGCRVNLDTLNVYKTQRDEVFCKNCYKTILESERSFTPVPTDVIKADPNDKQGCPRCGGKVFEAEKIPTKSSLFHRSCFSCYLCNHKLEPSTYIDGPNNEIFCKTCYNREYNSNVKNKFTEKKGVKAEQGDKEACLNCFNKVFMVDRVLAGNGVYHKYCLSCNNCKTALNQSNIIAGPVSKIYCKNCYDSLYGVRGRSGSIAGKLPNGAILADEDDPNRCPRCSGKVYDAEKVITSNGPFHKECFTCYGCDRSMNQKTCNSGQDGEIYCIHCYSEEFGIHSRRPRSRARSRPESRNRTRPGSRNGARSRSNSIINLDDEQGNRIMSQVKSL